jgi:hypothetical protein
MDYSNAKIGILVSDYIASCDEIIPEMIRSNYDGPDKYFTPHFFKNKSGMSSRHGKFLKHLTQDFAPDVEITRKKGLDLDMNRDTDIVEDNVCRINIDQTRVVEANGDKEIQPKSISEYSVRERTAYDYVVDQIIPKASSSHDTLVVTDEVSVDEESKLNNSLASIASALKEEIEHDTNEEKELSNDDEPLPELEDEELDVDEKEFEIHSDVSSSMSFYVSDESDYTSWLFTSDSPTTFSKDLTRKDDMSPVVLIDRCLDDNDMLYDYVMQNKLTSGEKLSSSQTRRLKSFKSNRYRSLHKIVMGIVHIVGLRFNNDAKSIDLIDKTQIYKLYHSTIPTITKDNCLIKLKYIIYQICTLGFAPMNKPHNLMILIESLTPLTGPQNK